MSEPRIRVRRPDPPMADPQDPFEGAPVLPVPSSMLTVMGVDQSLTNTGIGVLNEARLWSSSLIPPKDRNRGVTRLSFFRESFTHLVRQASPDLIAMEGYSYGSKNSHSHSLGELGGVLKLAALDCGVPVMIVSPNDVKLFATGKGNSPKPTVSKEAYKRWGIDLNDDNQVDAAVLALMALAQLDGLYRDKLADFQKRALTKVSE